MRKVSASDWIRRSAEYPRGDGPVLLPAQVRTLRRAAAKEKLPAIAKVSEQTKLPAQKSSGAPPVAAAAGKARALEMASAAPPVAAAAGKAKAAAPASTRPLDAAAVTNDDPPPARPKTRMEAMVAPQPAPVKRPRPQFEPLPVQLPSRDLVTKVTRQRRESRPVRKAKLTGDLAPAAFLLIALCYALVAGGHFEQRGGSLRGLVNQVASMIGLSADDVRIVGLEQQTREQVLSAIGVEEGGSLIGFDANLARQKLENLDWISQASVLRLFPNKLLIELTERHPFALWQSDGVFKVIDKSGIPMPSLNVRAYRHLPIVVGEGANLAAADLVNYLEAQPELMSQTRAAVRVADRRWVLYLTNTIKVDLPEDKVDEALVLLKTLIDRYGIMTRDIVNIDMRLHDRVVVRLSDEAAEKLKSSKNAKPVKVSRSQ
ncbi:cell division protein FtsQ/DivIB [Rhodoligotrophos defluvii]|uniref:cell division protein FtsQ/DivIB n=1 Tax=Rhodoligotrophos defluvii TaxID=2561934 RepID=UPI0010C97A49|nr:FtsQ-type POTRA domain-containing protein [Rhodoligotrophos defluvii]